MRRGRNKIILSLGLFSTLLCRGGFWSLEVDKAVHSCPWHYAYRRIRDINPFERQVEEIFREVVREVDKEGKIPLDYEVPGRKPIFTTLAKLLSLNIPNKGKDYIRDHLMQGITKELDKISRAEKYPQEQILQRAYETLKRNFAAHQGMLDNIKLPESFEEFKSRTLFVGRPPIQDYRIAGSYFPFVDKIIMNVSHLGYPFQADLIVHEWLHRISPGFFNSALNEGTVELLLSRTNGLRERSYPLEIQMVSELVELVSLDTWLRAYSRVSYEPLKEKLERGLIEAFELIELVQISTPLESYIKIVDSILAEFGAEQLKHGVQTDPITFLIWQNRENRNLLSDLKARLTSYLYGSSP